MWVGNFLARLIWSVCAVVRHAYLTRVHGLVATEAVGLVRPIAYRQFPADWPVAVFSFAPRPSAGERDDYDHEDGEVFSYLLQFRGLLREVWRMKDWGMDVAFISVHYAHVIGDDGFPTRGR